jgi:amidase
MDAADLAYAGIAEQARLIAEGQLKSRDFVEIYLDRIQRYDPKLNAFRVVFRERARMEADQADARREAGDRRPLLGVPIAVKDEFDVAGEDTCVGSNAYGEPARADSEIVRRVRAAGAVLIGKTNVPELCAFPWTESATWGATRNPWDLDRSPGGSSGGSAAAVAAGLVGAALAADGGGSIRFPAAYCGLFGLKTQRGRVPLAPDVDSWHGLTVAGVLTRSVADAALFYDAIAEGPPDPGAPTPPAFSFREAAGLGGVERAGERSDVGGAAYRAGAAARPLRIAVSTKLPPSPLTRLRPENRAAVEETAELLRSLGHEVREVEVDYGPSAPPPEFTVRFLRSLHDKAAGMAHPERLERRMQRVALRVGGLLPESALRWARGREAAYAARVNKVLEENDVLLCPMTPAPAPKIGAVEGRGWLWTAAVAAATVPYAAVWNLTGQPACSVPAGFAADGLPRAVQLVGKANDEATLVALAAGIEAARPWAGQRPKRFS